MFTDNELKRYNRHIILPEVGLSGQENLKKSKVLVIGAGGLGCPVLQYLTAAGIGTIGILEFDTVSESNLQRQILYSTADIGKKKVQVAHQKMSELNPHIKFQIYDTKITKENALKIIENYKIIVDCTDNFPTRYLISDACVILNKTLVYGALYKFDGQVSVFNYKNGPTYRCLFPDQPAQNETPNCSQIGVIGVLPGIIGTLQANEVIKICLEKEQILSGVLLQFNALSMRFDKINFNKNTSVSPIEKLGNYEETCTTEQKVNNISPEELKKLIDNKQDIIIYDTRLPGISNLHNIGGKRLDIEKVLDNKITLSKDKKTIIVCDRGNDSLLITKYLQMKLGYTNIYNLTGGMESWIKKGY